MSSLHNQLRIQLLGQFKFVCNDEVVGLVQPRLQALLAYLALHSDAPLARRQIAFTFWPDSSEARAQGNLRKLLHDLRQAWPQIDAFLHIDRHLLQWHNTASLTVDALAFAALVTAAEQAATRQEARSKLEATLDLYTGDLLPACYDEWLLPERERLRQAYLNALEQVSHLCAAQGDLAAALSHAQHLVQADPLQESAYRLLMQLYLRSGDRARAFRVYHTCATIAVEELGVDPSPETHALYQQLLNLEETTPATSSSQRHATFLVGRRLEWQRLLRAWQQAAQGAPHFVLIAGEAGIGKSRLAGELMGWAEGRSITVVHARAYAAEGSIVYAPLRDWLRSEPLRPVLMRLDPLWLSEIGRLLPELLVQHPELPRPEPLAEQWQRQRLFAALAHAFAAVNAPLLLVLDDLQWCDRETLEWLHYLLRADAQARLLIAGTVRPEEVDAQHPLTTLLLHLRAAEQLTEIELGPLDAAETAALAGQVMDGELDPHSAARLYQATEGNPLFVVESVRAALGKRNEVQSGLYALPEPLLLPPKVQATIQARLAQLTPAARELAQVAATIGRAFELELLARASEVEAETLVRGLDELWQRRLIREQGESAYDFSHDRIREATYSSVSQVRRHLLHRKVAVALEQVRAADLYAVSGQIAAHYESAGLLEEAIVYYQRAAEAAQGIYAHVETLQYLDKELALLRQLPVTTEHLRQELRLQLVMGVSMAVVRGISNRELKGPYARALTLATEVGDDRERLAAVGGLHMAELFSGQMQLAYELAKQGLVLAERIGDPSGLVEACSTMATVLWNLGQLRESRVYLEQAIGYKEYQWDSSTQIRWPLHHGVVVQHFTALVLWHLGYPDQAQEELTRALLLAQEVNHPYTLTLAIDWSSELHLLRRELIQAQVMAEQAIMLCERHGFHNVLPECLLIMGRVLAQLGQIEVAVARANEALVGLQAIDGELNLEGMLYLAEIYGMAGQPAEGMQLVDAALNQTNATGMYFTLAEIYRVKGELLHMQEADKEEIERNFLESLAVARQQEAKSLELRTAISLSRFWQQQGKRRQAYDLLAGIYGWFTEGFDTHDLKEAAALLQALS